MSDSLGRVLTSLEQQHRFDLGKMALQLELYKQQLRDAGIEPDDRTDAELIRLWKAAAHTVSSASAFVAELGTGKELIDPDLVIRNG